MNNIVCENCGKEFDQSKYGPIVFNPLSQEVEVVTICPNCLMALLKHYTKLDWEFETFIKSYLKRRQNESHKYSLDQYKKSIFYLTTKEKIEEFDGKKYDSEMELIGKFMENSEYYLICSKMFCNDAFLPRHYLLWECTKWNKNSGGPDFIYNGQKNKKHGIEITDISHNVFKFNKDVSQSYINKCLDSVSVKEGKFTEYLTRSISILNEKNIKAAKYEKCDYLELFIVSTQAMKSWHYYFLEIFLNNVNFENCFTKIRVV